MPTNAKYFAIGLVCLLIGASGYWLYQDQQRPGVEISIGRQGVSIEQR